MKLALGTVQFGLDYGISNHDGQVMPAQVNEILAIASKANISAFDTASSYGNSEAIIGTLMTKEHHDIDAHYLGKIAPTTAPDSVIDEVKQSLSDLNIKQFECISSHHAQWLLNDDSEQNYQALLSTKQNQLTKKIGCSVYSIEQALALIRRFNIDVIQLPANICDQQVLDNEFLAFCQQENIEIHIRSLFLQGALLMPTSKLPAHLKTLSTTHTKLDNLSSQLNVSRMALLLAPFIQHPNISKIIVGCCSSTELAEIVRAYGFAKNCHFNYQDFAILDDNITNPSKWPQ